MCLIRGSNTNMIKHSRRELSREYQWITWRERLGKALGSAPQGAERPLRDGVML